jgi:uncharacterized Zn finger protein
VGHWDEWDDWYPSYPKMSPRPVREGIKARRKGKIGGETWWAGRWIAVLESFGWEWSSRLHRGRRYARRGQVIGYEIAPGQITASVQGSRPEPYSVAIQVRQLSRREWNKVADVLSRQAMFTAKLLAGEMPLEIEEAFKKTKASLFPASGRELNMRCSCPDPAVPCKHIAAVYYIVGEAFDRDPFLMFHLRGLARDDLLGLLRKKRAGEAAAPQAGERRPARDAGKVQQGRPLEIGPEKFWEGAGGLEGFQVSVAHPAVKIPVLRRLGPIPFWTEAADFSAFMERISTNVSRTAVDLAYRPGSHGLHSPP